MIPFCIIGDMGSGPEEQYIVGNSMTKNIIMKNNVKFVCGLGDNIYPSGCEDIDDPQFIEKFEKPYENIPDDIKFYMCIGNHDYRIIGINYGKIYQMFKIKYSHHSQKYNKKWYLPKHYYTFSKSKGGVTIDFVIDTGVNRFNVRRIEK